ncbi:MAG: DUF1573 domain-containing protein [Catalinimonas sp.]
MKYAAHLFSSGLALTVLLMTTACQEASSTGTGASVESTGAAEGPELSAREVVNNPSTASTPTGTDNSAVAEISFPETTHNFGRVVAGQKVRHTYTFENTGAAPLLIESASASCGCTVPDWPKTPIAPGESGEIKVEFNSSGRVGQQSKTVTIRANTQPNQTQLLLTGEVLSDEKGPVRQ